ncbi:MAG: hypothetical protein HZB46_15830 [Solirubrobacterales bacterium]|nr:hypothetical protein [Solirubrobacterales bacterium]
MTRLAAALFGVLVAATFAAFFVAQRIKDEPSVIQGVRFRGSFSPNEDGRADRVRFALRLKESDRVTLGVVDADGDTVRTLVEDRRAKAYEVIGLPGIPWDGRDDDGRVVPDGRYKLRITLRDQGRSVVYPRSVRKDTTPPAPRVTSIGPSREPGPELLPNADGKVTARFGPALDAAQVLLVRTAPGRPRKVLRQDLPKGATEWSWDGRVQGRRVSPGTYLVVLIWQDEAGNRGASVPLGRSDVPRLRYGRKLPGHGGITVRYLAAQPAMAPTKARGRTELFLDARGERFSWSLRRLGGSVRARGGPKTRPRVVFQAPGGKSGVYVFRVTTRERSTQVLVPVQARQPVAGTAKRPRGVLVLLPAMTWQGRNPVDDDGDGAPNLLDLGVAATLRRLAAGDGLPEGFRDREAPLLLWLDRTGRRYDVTTDAALQAGFGPRLAGHRGVLIPGDARWLPSTVRARLRAFVRGGGTVVSLGIDSLRRTVAVNARGRMVDPSRPRPADLFGARLAPLRRQATDLENFQDEIELFTGTSGLISAVPAWEETARIGREADQVASGVTVDPPGRSVITAARFGKGLVIRPGFPSFAQRVNANDPAVSELMARMWTLLSR